MKRILLAAAVIAALVMGFSSCKKEDNKQNPTTPETPETPEIPDSIGTMTDALCYMVGNTVETVSQIAKKIGYTYTGIDKETGTYYYLKDSTDYSESILIYISDNTIYSAEYVNYVNGNKLADQADKYMSEVGEKHTFGNTTHKFNSGEIDEEYNTYNDYYTLLNDLNTAQKHIHAKWLANSSSSSTIFLQVWICDNMSYTSLEVR